MNPAQTTTVSAPASKLVRKLVFLVLIGIGLFVFLLNCRSCEKKQKDKAPPPPPIVLQDVWVAPGQAMRTYKNVQILRNDEEILLLTYNIWVTGINKMSEVTYMLDKTSMKGTWEQEFQGIPFLTPRFSGPLEMKLVGPGQWTGKTYDGRKPSKGFFLSGVY